MNTEPWVTSRVKTYFKGPSGSKEAAQLHPASPHRALWITMSITMALLYSPKWTKASLYSGYDSTSLWLFLFLGLLLFLLSGSPYCCLCCYSLFSMSRPMGRTEAHPEDISPKIRNLIGSLLSPSKMKPLYWAQDSWTSWQCWPIVCPSFNIQ